MSTKIYIKNSSVSGKVPAAGDIDSAELALNLADKKLYSKDASGTIFEIGRSTAGETPSGGTGDRPGSPSVGDLFYDTDLEILIYWDGSEWVEVGSGSEVIVSPTPPATVDLEEGTLWWNSDANDLNLYVLYNDPSPDAGLKWIEASPGGGDPLDPDDYVKLNDGGTKQVIQSAGLGLSDGTTENITLGANGTGTFSGTVISGPGYPGGGANNAAALTDGTVVVTREGSQSIWTGFNKGSGTATSQITAEGRATFTSVDGITLGNGAGSTNVWRLIPSDGGVPGAFQIYNSDTAKGIKILDDGGVNFANTVRVDSSASTGNAQLLRLGNANNSGSKSAHLFTANGYYLFPNDVDGTGYVSKLADDGSADFRSYIRSNPVPGVGTYTQLDGTNGLEVINGNSTKASISMNGTATFGGDKIVLDAVNGQLNVKTAPSTGSAVVIRDSGNSLVSSIDQSGGAAFYNSGIGAYVWVNDKPGATAYCLSGGDVRNNGSPKWYVENNGRYFGTNITFFVAPEDPDNYETTTEEYTITETYTGPRGGTLTREIPQTREIKTYVGPTLDVKDELIALRARAERQDAVIATMTRMLGDLGADVSTMPALEEGGET